LKEREGVTASPLSWPTGWTRSRRRERSQFDRNLSVYKANQQVLAELERLGARNPIISTNLTLRRDGLPYSGQKAPLDPGVAVYFTLKGEERVLACDRWSSVQENLRAIAKHIEAIRGQLRWGVGSIEQAFRGFTGLPERAGQEAHWRVVLGFPAGAPVSPEMVNLRFKDLMRTRHTDVGGSQADAADLSRARVDALRELGS
jgi:hypothetical protein